MSEHPAEQAVVRCASRSRGSAREQAILRACLELVAERGYDRLTMDAVADRARASKATIYRRWSGKPQLIADALRICDSGVFAVEESGSLRGDLLAVLRAMRAKFGNQDTALIGGIIHAMQGDPELAGIMRAQIARNKQTVGEVIAKRALDRGEDVPDVELLRDVLTGQLIVRLLITGEPVDDAYLSQLVDRVLLPLLTRPAAEQCAAHVRPH